MTRLPTPSQLDYRETEWGKSVLWFPVVGLIIGVLLLASRMALDTVNPLLSAALITTLWVVLTGALHLDGFADTLDAWIGGMGNTEKTLTIMKDPTSGPMAVTGLILLLLLKFTAIYSLIVADASMLLLTLPIIARTQLILLLLTTPYAKASGMGYAMRQQMPMKMAWGMVWVLLIALIVCAPIALILAVLLSLLLLVVYRRALCRRIHGITGDTLGAWVEISEVVLLIALIVGS